MTIQLGWFTPMTQIIQQPIVIRTAAMMAVSDRDAVIDSGRLLIASASEFVPSTRVEENRCINTVYNDRTIVELSIFLLFQLDFYLFAEKDQHRQDKIRKVIHYYTRSFDQLLAGSDFDKLIYNRIQLYGEMAIHNKNYLADTLELLKEIILDTQKNGTHRIASLFPYKDDFHLASRLDYHLNVYFERHKNSLLTIYGTVKDTEPG